MEELIKKKTVLDICDRWRRRTSDTHDRNGFYIADTIYTQVQEIAEASPQGQWIEVDDSLISCKCSICGWEAHKYEDDVYGMPYCPNCGAKMREIDNE